MLQLGLRLLGRHAVLRGNHVGAWAPAAPLLTRSFAAEATQENLSLDGPLKVETPAPVAPSNVPLPKFYEPVKKKAVDGPVLFRDAVKAVKEGSWAKFDETLEIAINLGIDPRRGDQMVRGMAVLPHGTGKSIRVAVFAEGDVADAALAAGANVVGGLELIQEIKTSQGSSIKFDKAIAHPDMMPKLGQIARILGPKGLMPNPKVGTVTTNVVGAIADMQKGRVEFRADKGGIIHAGVGKLSFDDNKLEENMGALVTALLAARPRGVKGSGANGYFKKVTLSSTMGKGVPVTVGSLVDCTVRK